MTWVIGLIFGCIVFVLGFIIQSFRYMKIKKQKDFLETLFKNSSEYIIVFRYSDMMCEYVSSSSEKKSPWQSDFSVGHYPKDFVHPDDLALVEKFLESVKNGGNFSQALWRVYDALIGWTWIESQGILIRNYWGREVIVCFFRKVDDIVSLRSSLEEMKRRNQLILDNTFETLWQLDIDTREITLLNLDFKPDSLDFNFSEKSIDLQKIIWDEDLQKIQEIINKNLKTLRDSGKSRGETQEFSIRFKAKSGNPVLYEIRATMLKDMAGRFEWVGIFRRASQSFLENFKK